MANPPPPPEREKLGNFLDVWVLRYGLNKIMGTDKPWGHVYMSRDWKHIAKDCPNAKQDFALMRISKDCLTTPKVGHSAQHEIVGRKAMAVLDAMGQAGVDPLDFNKFLKPDISASEQKEFNDTLDRVVVKFTQPHGKVGEK